MECEKRIVSAKSPSDFGKVFFLNCLNQYADIHDTGTSVVPVYLPLGVVQKTM